jgi:hypothetical protein
LASQNLVVLIFRRTRSILEVLAHQSGWNNLYWTVGTLVGHGRGRVWRELGQCRKVRKVAGIEVEPAQADRDDNHREGRHHQQCFENDSHKRVHIRELCSVGEALPESCEKSRRERRWTPRTRELDRSTLNSTPDLVKTLDGWTDSSFHVVPARGKVTTGATVKTLRDMIVTVRDRIKRMIEAGRTEREVLAEHPTTDFDAEWGHGRVRPEEFVHDVYIALKEQ